MSGSGNNNSESGDSAPPTPASDYGLGNGSIGSDNVLGNGSLGALLLQEQLELLDTMDKLRSYGVSEFVSLPQIVVCGDQSAGKSSVLEAITEIRFPSKDNLCTTFATEIILRRSPETKASVRIIPSASGIQRSQEQKDKLAEFHHTMKSFDDLPELIENSKLAMGLDTGTTFSQDVLSIEISGPTQPHLTVVDLPGLIHTGKSTDVQLVSDLVASYMQNPRTIILAVVSARNDYQNQIVLSRAKVVDPEGRRTLGVITKPDAPPVGSESESAFIRLAQNEDITFGLGWHVLRNRCFEERNSSFEERNRVEEKFFQTGAWQDIPKSSVGIVALRSRLSQLLYDHIKGELPKVHKDICAALKSCEEKLFKLGDKRETTNEQRAFLTKLSMDYVGVCKSAVDGYYDDIFFGEGVTIEASDVPKRLRAVIQKMNAAFAKTIREQGRTHLINKKSDPASISNNGRYPHGRAGPKKITHAEAIAWVKPLIDNGRGRELPGTFNPILVCPLFHEQSKKWEAFAVSHLNQAFAACREFLSQLVPHIAKGNASVSSALFQRWFNEAMNQQLSEAKKELEKLFEDRRRHAVTYNHYYTDNIQKSEEEDEKEMLTAITEQFPNYSTSNQRAIALDFKNRLENNKTEVNMEDYACEQLLRSMKAYYKVASKTFIDNVATQVIERHLMSGFWDMFSPLSIVSMSDQRIASIAAESYENRTLRSSLEVKKERLTMGLDACRGVLPDIETNVEIEDEAVELELGEEAVVEL